jgi:hypothetical protein
MNCYDCAVVNHPEPAVAICVDCGAAVCHEHAHLAPRWLTYTVAINRTVRVEPPGRAVRCATCQTAHDAAAATSAA